jgi:hypothetical protein
MREGNRRADEVRLDIFDVNPLPEDTIEMLLPYVFNQRKARCCQLHLR